MHLAARPAHTASHYKANVARTDDCYIFARNIAFDIDEALGKTCGVDTRWPCPGNANVPSIPLPAAHSQNDCPRFDAHHAFLCRNSIDHLVFVIFSDIEHCGLEQDLNISRIHFFLESLGKFRACKLFVEFD